MALGIASSKSTSALEGSGHHWRCIADWFEILALWSKKVIVKSLRSKGRFCNLYNCHLRYWKLTPKLAVVKALVQEVDLGLGDHSYSEHRHLIKTNFAKDHVTNADIQNMLLFLCSVMQLGAHLHLYCSFLKFLVLYIALEAEIEDCMEEELKEIEEKDEKNGGRSSAFVFALHVSALKLPQESFGEEGSHSIVVEETKI